MQPDGIALVINDDSAWDQPVAEAIAKGINVIGMNSDDTDLIELSIPLLSFCLCCFDVIFLPLHPTSCLY